MSRSYKKTPGFTNQQSNGKHSIFAKRQANKKVRRFYDFIPNGKSYKKLYSRYDICDYKFLEFTKEQLNEVLDRFEARGEDRIRWYYKFYSK